MNTLGKFMENVSDKHKKQGGYSQEMENIFVLCVQEKRGDLNEI